MIKHSYNQYIGQAKIQ